MSLELPTALVDDIVSHAREEYPNECCGILAGRGGRVERIFRGVNVDLSPYTYRLDPHDQLRIFRAIDAAGLELLGIYHSHTQSSPYPSRTDVAKAYYPDAVYVIVAIQNGGPAAVAPEDSAEVRAFRIRDGVISEEELVEG
jgi:proteasome lid subunit RPN8/RPN11